MLKGQFNSKKKRFDLIVFFRSYFVFIFILFSFILSFVFNFNFLGGYPLTSDIVKDSFFSTGSVSKDKQ